MNKEEINLLNTDLLQRYEASKVDENLQIALQLKEPFRQDMNDFLAQLG